MDVMVKGMKMPDRCYDCVGCHDWIDTPPSCFCAISAEFGEGPDWLNKHHLNKERPDWCPLVELIHCVDCEYWETFAEDIGECINKPVGHWTRGQGFCSAAKKKQHNE